MQAKTVRLCLWELYFPHANKSPIVIIESVSGFFTYAEEKDPEHQIIIKEYFDEVGWMYQVHSKCEKQEIEAICEKIKKISLTSGLIMTRRKTSTPYDYLQSQKMSVLRRAN